MRKFIADKDVIFAFFIGYLSVEAYDLWSGVLIAVSIFLIGNLISLRKL